MLDVPTLEELVEAAEQDVDYRIRTSILLFLYEDR